MSEAAAPDWYFYHLECTTLEQAAGALLEKCLEHKKRVLAISPHPERRAALDAALWTYNDDSFLPHGRVEAEGLVPAAQPVLISPEADNKNAATFCLLMDGVEIGAGASFERCMVMFDGGDQATLPENSSKRLRNAGKRFAISSKHQMVSGKKQANRGLPNA